MKWRKDAKEGVIVAGGNGDGDNPNQLFEPCELFVDKDRQIYVAETHNQRIMRWTEGAKEGEIIIGRNEWGQNLNELPHLNYLIFDVEGNLYVNEWKNYRIQKFDLIL